jgi:hypothetical protein
MSRAGIKPWPPALQAGTLPKSYLAKTLMTFLKTPALSCFHGFLSTFLAYFMHRGYSKQCKNDKQR